MRVVQNSEEKKQHRLSWDDDAGHAEGNAMDLSGVPSISPPGVSDAVSH